MSGLYGDKIWPKRCETRGTQVDKHEEFVKDFAEFELFVIELYYYLPFIVVLFVGIGCYIV